MNYTKGEWKVEYEHGDILIGTNFQNIVRMCLDDKHTMVANANLIAAAPDMCKALKDIITWFTHCGYDRELPQYRHCEEALAKVVGKK